MQKITLAVASLAALVFASPLCAAKEAKPDWSDKMRKLSAVLSDVLPDLASGRTPDAKTLERLKKSADTIASMAHGVQKQTMDAKAPAPDADPSLALMATVFEREAKAAAQALKSGHTEYGKAALRLVTSHCISCHTRSDAGPQFPALPLNPKTRGLNRMEKGQLLTALRQYDAALEEFESVISDPMLSTRRQLEWGRAVRHAFAIAVRVKQDPERALKIVKRIEALPAVPMLFKDLVSSWKASVVEWKKSPKLPTSESELLQAVQRLSEQATSQQRFPMDHSADIAFLRASLAGHEFLRLFPQSKDAPEVLLLLGSAYDLLDDHLLSPLPEMYFETCIRKAPHTPVAQKCYKRYESNLFFGFTGSGGTSIPDDLDTVRKELSALAKPKKS